MKYRSCVIQFAALFCVPLLLGACSAEKAPAVIAAKSLSAATTAATSPEIVSETAALLYSKDTLAEGTVNLSEIASCGGVKFDGHWTAGVNQVVQMRSELGVLGLAFEPGVQHHFAGRVCIPMPGLPYTEEARANAAFHTVLVKDDYVKAIDGPVEFSGSATFAPKDGVGKVFIVESNTSEPLLFVVTQQGYRHLSGKGSLVTPDGHRYEFQ